MNGWLTFHLIGVLLMVGNIVTAAFWKVRADMTGNPSVIHHAAKNVMTADYMFTVPGLILIVASGSAMAEKSGISMAGLNWLTLSLFLFAISGVIWLAILLPLQRRMIQHSANSVDRGAITPEYRRASRQWAIFGIAATLLPIAILYLMVMKSF